MKLSQLLTFVANAIFIIANRGEARRAKAVEALRLAMPVNTSDEIINEFVSFLDWVARTQLKATALGFLHLASTVEMIENPVQYLRRQLQSYAVAMRQDYDDEAFETAKELIAQMESLMDEDQTNFTVCWKEDKAA